MREQNIGTKDQINNVFSNIEMIYKVGGQHVSFFSL
jgi:hypothetical protein